jgi:hypothetical protein
MVFCTSKGKHRRQVKSPKVRLQLEQLEDRLVPSTATANVLSYHNDPQGTGQNLNETVLTPANVNPSTFGKLFSTSVDGQVYAQPLYMSGLNITSGPEQGLHNVVFVATEHDSLYAIDGDTGQVLWQDALLTAEHGGTVTTVPSDDVNAGGDIAPEIGITATPVIDPNNITIFVEAKEKEVADDGSHYEHHLYAINIQDGSITNEVLIADSVGDTYVSGPTVNGTGDTGFGLPEGTVGFDALRQMDRPAVSLVNGNLYLAFASHGDNEPYSGWVLGYAESTLALTAVFNTVPNGSEAGIWQSGGSITSDADGNLYVETGNGTFDTTLIASPFNPGLNIPNQGDYGDSLLKLTPDGTTAQDVNNPNGWGLHVSDYFTPFNQADLSATDADLGSSGPIVLPDSAGSAAHPHLLVGSDKRGAIFLIDRDNMGGFDPTGDNIVQELPDGTIGGSWGVGAYFNGAIYYVGVGDTAKSFTISDGTISTNPTSQSSDGFGYPGATPAISADGSSNGILWATDRDTNQLRAYDASDLSNELYNSDQNPGDSPGSIIKFAPPTVAGGHVFVGTDGVLSVYRLTQQAAVDLSNSFNRVGIVTDGSTFTGGLDGDGSALSANLLGSSVSWNGQTFALGSPDTNNVVSAAGQTINLPAGNYSSLNFLATGVNGNQPNQTFTVTYTDGTTQTFTQSISDWYTPQGYSGESTAVSTAYRDNGDGSMDNRTFNVYGYSLALDGSKTVQSVTLPNDGNVEILAITLR